MDRFRKRKLMASTANAANDATNDVTNKLGSQSDQCRVLRSKSGRKISEDDLAKALTLVDTVNRKAPVRTPKTSLRGAPSPRASTKGKRTAELLGDAGIETPGAPRKLSTRMRRETEMPSLHTPSSLGIGLVDPCAATAQNAVVPVDDLAPRGAPAFPVWTEEEMMDAMEHICSVDACKRIRCSPI
jgi:hypothetical protein